MASNDFCSKSSIYIDLTAVYLNVNARREDGLGEKRGEGMRCEVIDFNRNENVEPIGARSLVRVFDAKSIM